MIEFDRGCGVASDAVRASDIVAADDRDHAAAGSGWGRGTHCARGRAPHADRDAALRRLQPARGRRALLQHAARRPVARAGTARDRELRAAALPLRQQQPVGPERFRCGLRCGGPRRTCSNRTSDDPARTPRPTRASSGRDGQRGGGAQRPPSRRFETHALQLHVPAGAGSREFRLLCRPPASGPDLRRPSRRHRAGADGHLPRPEHAARRVRLEWSCVPHARVRSSLRARARRPIGRVAGQRDRPRAVPARQFRPARLHAPGVSHCG